MGLNVVDSDVSYSTFTNVFFYLCHICCVFNVFLNTLSQKGTSILLPITLADVDGFSKFFHR